MSYKQIKGLILISPTVTIALWEYVRHHLLMKYISMETGNWLAPVLVFAVSITFLLKLFSMLETMQEELGRERNRQSAIKERERMARELHDGIAQSLFLLSVKIDQLEQGPEGTARAERIKSLRQTVHQINEYVRLAIANLRYSPSPGEQPWLQYMQSMIKDFTSERGLIVHEEWQLPENRLTAKEKVELYASVREALINVHKHAEARNIWVQATEEADGGWVCKVVDDGHGVEGDPFGQVNHYGLEIMRERALEMGWDLRLYRTNHQTVVEIRKEG